jgi:hypothetical protein
VNTPIFKRVMNFTDLISESFVNKRFLVFAFALACVAAPSLARAEWKVDFSRRNRATREADLDSSAAQGPTTNERSPSSVRSNSDLNSQPDVSSKTTVANDEGPETKKSMFDSVFGANEPVQEIVILNTEKGFVPSSVHVRKNGHYKIHVVNVNEKEKNVSFILDGFSEHHATYYGKIKTFTLEPKKEGVFSFQSPETAAEGRLVVFSPQMSVRAPASGDEK